MGNGDLILQTISSNGVARNDLSWLSFLAGIRIIDKKHLVRALLLFVLTTILRKILIF